MQNMPFTYWLNLHNSAMNEDTHGVFKNVQYYPEMSNVTSRPFLSKKITQHVLQVICDIDLWALFYDSH